MLDWVTRKSFAVASVNRLMRRSGSSRIVATSVIDSRLSKSLLVDSSSATFCASWWLTVCISSLSDCSSSLTEVTSSARFAAANPRGPFDRRGDDRGRRFAGFVRRTDFLPPGGFFFFAMLLPLAAQRDDSPSTRRTVWSAAGSYPRRAGGSKRAPRRRSRLRRTSLSRAARPASFLVRRGLWRRARLPAADGPSPPGVAAALLLTK